MNMRPLSSYLISLLILGAVPLRAAQTAGSAQTTGSIDVDVNGPVAPVNHLVFGHNIEAADNAFIFSSNSTDPDLIQRGGGFWDPTKGAPAASILNESKSVAMSVLRYPGGCLAHNFDWRKSVGPEAKAKGWLFGLDEYMSLCRAIGSIPIITVSDYALSADQMPENAAELVEYLNSPADPAHPWAMKRKEWGHAAPYGVQWFELGNESMHGNHRVQPFRQYTAEQYAAYAKATAAAMRKVDPRVKIGIVTVPGAGNDVDSYWNRTVVHLAGPSADFLIIHMYAPQQLPSSTPENLRVQAMMAAPQQVNEHLLEYHQMLRKELGHDLPLAITEFNGALDQPNERLGYANALECSDLLRVFLEPETNVAVANYWDFTSGLFGMVRRPQQSSNSDQDAVAPAFLFYELWAQHFGSKLLRVETQSPRTDFAGAGTEMAATGSAPEPKRQIQRVDLQKYSSYASTLWPRLLNVQIQHDDSNVTVHLQGLNRSIFPLLARIPRPNNVSNSPVEFSVSFDARFTPAPGSATAPMGIGLIDSRGWDATHSGIGLDDISSTWQHFDGTYRLEPQTTSVDLSARLMAGGKNASGTLEVHNLTVTEFISPHDAAYPLLTSAASTSSDGSHVYLIVFNKSMTSSIPAAIHLKGFSAARAMYWQVSDPVLKSASERMEQPGAALPLSSARSANYEFPAHSMTSIEFSKLP